MATAGNASTKIGQRRKTVQNRRSDRNPKDSRPERRTPGGKSSEIATTRRHRPSPARRKSTAAVNQSLSKKAELPTEFPTSDKPVRNYGHAIPWRYTKMKTLNPDLYHDEPHEQNLRTVNSANRFPLLASQQELSRRHAHRLNGHAERVSTSIWTSPLRVILKVAEAFGGHR